MKIVRTTDQISTLGQMGLSSSPLDREAIVLCAILFVSRPPIHRARSVGPIVGRQ
jgi:hypothetical protein